MENKEREEDLASERRKDELKHKGGYQKDNHEEEKNKKENDKSGPVPNGIEEESY